MMGQTSHPDAASNGNSIVIIGAPFSGPVPRPSAGGFGKFLLMPIASPRPCVAQPCPNFGKKELRGRCDTHAHQANVQRGSSSARGYDSVWRRARLLCLRSEPLCRECMKEGIFDSPTTQVDHIIPIAQRPDLRLVRSNLQGLCDRHHSEKTIRENPNPQAQISIQSISK